MGMCLFGDLEKVGYNCNLVVIFGFLYYRKFIIFCLHSRYSNVLAYRWGTLDQRDELLVEPRPLFQVCYFLISQIVRMQMYVTSKAKGNDYCFMCWYYLARFVF